MTPEEPKSHITEWLERLERESWNLELLVSGFSIYLLLEAAPLLQQTLLDFSVQFLPTGAVKNVVFSFLSILLLSSKVLAVNLIVHVALRGFWIGAIGLRSIQPVIRYDRLNYSPFFTKKLQQHLPGLDKLILQLDAVCSAIFSFTFLIVFMLLSLAMWVSSLSIVALIINLLLAPLPQKLGDPLSYIMIVVVLLWAFIGLIYFLDTMTLGFFKKFNRLSRIYYPMYKLYSWVTLSFIYRGIYYHLISRFGKWRIGFALGCYMCLFLLTPFVKYDQFIFFPDKATTNKLQTGHYDTMRLETETIAKASIPSTVIREPSLPLFIQYDLKHNVSLQKLCTGYIPSKGEGGFISGFKLTKDGLQVSDPDIEEQNPDSLLNCLTQFYEVYVDDSLHSNLKFFYLRHPQTKVKGIYTVANIAYLPVGPHEVRIDVHLWKEEQQQFEISNYTTIPFWKHESADD